MITLSESGLTSEEYAVLQSQVSYPVWQVLVHRADPVFAMVADARVLDTTSDDFDAVVTSDKLIRLGHEGLDILDLAAQTWTLEEFPIEFEGAPSLVASGDVVTAFVHDGTDIYRYSRDFSDPEDDWAGGIIHTPTTPPVHVAATSASRCHAVLYNSTKRLSNLICLEFDGVWDEITSDIFWMYPVESFDAETNVNGVDSIVMVTLTPGLILTKAINTQVVKTMEASGGVVAFTYRAQSWSDHFEVEIIDNLSNSRYRRGVKMSLINEKLVACVFSVDGTPEFPIGFYRHYTSEDGKFWSMGKSFNPPSEHSTFGMKILTAGEYLYAVEEVKTSRSLKTFPWGTPAEEYTHDVSRNIESMSIQRASVSQLALGLSDSTGTYEEHPFINKRHLFYIQVFAGYYETIDSEDPIMVLVGTFRGESYEYNWDGPSRIIRITGRDALALLMDESESEQAHYWESQLVGGDEYQDETGTNYGGLRHTGTQMGTFTTGDQVLRLRNNNLRGMAFSTFDAFIWNGGQGVRFRLSAPTGTEYGGVVFRAIDKDNFWYAAYVQSTDTIVLSLTLGAQDNIKAQSARKNWATDPRTWRWIRVEFKYAQIRVYSSEDGVTWALEIDYLSDGMGNISGIAPTVQTAIPEKGFVGIVGQGFSDEELWDFPELADPPINILIPDWSTGDWDFDFGDEGGGELNIGVTWNELGELARTMYWTLSFPRWDEIEVPHPVIHCSWDYHSPFYEDGTGFLNMWVAARNETDIYIYYIEDVMGDPVVEEIYTDEIEAGDMKIRPSRSSSNVIEMGVRTDTGYRLYRTSDGGDNWTDTGVTYGSGLIDEPIYFDLRTLTSLWPDDDAVSWRQSGGTPDIVDNAPQVLEPEMFVALPSDNYAYVYVKHIYPPDVYTFEFDDEEVAGSAIGFGVLNEVNRSADPIPFTDTMLYEVAYEFYPPLRYSDNFVIGQLYEATASGGADIPNANGWLKVWFYPEGSNNAYHWHYTMHCSQAVYDELAPALIPVSIETIPDGARIKSIRIEGVFDDVLVSINQSLTLGPNNYGFSVELNETPRGHLYSVFNYRSEDLVNPNPDIATWTDITPQYRNGVSAWTLRDDVRYITAGDQNSGLVGAFVVHDESIGHNMVVLQTDALSFFFWNSRDPLGAYYSRSTRLIEFGDDLLYQEAGGDKRGNLEEVLEHPIGIIKGVLTL